ncbi:competence type IV pilus assembly protein ComGB [Paenilisteria rocourtiae]|uniref:Competence protein ComGB n=1 Tax=Listeria rocourtiae TaxID=647910 RepID=A0A4R6ZNJ4_9LIST|nr:competence type IV pilus assembly protein ComGB [Listeria rocourtiae]EUJ51180.1 general secretion pathway protein [Listeria rocourtiae FSL F6-920]MBC1603708.1 type II secretion system F family protein [Listeria rocourtiae]TDR54067.1 competence protein ComGB [Listeria rocourtiae]
MAFSLRNNWRADGEFLIRLADLLSKGFTMEEAISFLSITAPKDALRNEKIIEVLSSGAPFSEALSQANFPSFVCTQLHYASKHGYFSETVQETGDHLIRKAEQQKALRKVFQYPLILFMTVIVVFFLLRIFLLPKFDTLFSQLKHGENQTTNFTYFILEKLPLIFLAFLGFVFIICTFFLTKQRKKNSYERAQLYCALPVLKKFMRLHYSQLFARECGYLLKSGLSINDMVQVFALPDSPSLFKHISEFVEKAFSDGTLFTKSLATFTIFEPEMIYIVQHGEKNGQLAEELLFYYKLCHQKSEEKIEKIFSFIQPAVFMIIGILIVSIYLSILFPMFSMVNSI